MNRIVQLLSGEAAMRHRVRRELEARLYLCVERGGTESTCTAQQRDARDARRRPPASCIGLSHEPPVVTWPLPREPTASHEPPVVTWPLPREPTVICGIAEVPNVVPPDVCCVPEETPAPEVDPDPAADDPAADEDDWAAVVAVVECPV